MDVLKKIERRVRDDVLVERLVNKVKNYLKTKNERDDLTLQESGYVYGPYDYGDVLPLSRKRDLDIDWSNHAEYRSDLRDVSPPKVNEAIRDWLKERLVTKGPDSKKVRMKLPGQGTAVVDYDLKDKPADADVVTVWAAERVDRITSRIASSWTKRRHTWRLDGEGAHILVTPRWAREWSNKIAGYDVSGFVRGLLAETTGKDEPYSNLRQAKKAGEALLRKLESSRTAAAPKVEKTGPDSKYKFKVTYPNGQVKYTNEPPQQQEPSKEEPKEEAPKKGLKDVAKSVKEGLRRWKEKGAIKDEFTSQLWSEAESGDEPPVWEDENQSVAVSGRNLTVRYTDENDEIQEVRVNMENPDQNEEPVKEALQKFELWDKVVGVSEKLQGVNKKAASDRLRRVTAALLKTIPREHDTLWYENEAGEKWLPDMKDPLAEAPDGFKYQVSRFPTQLNTNWLKIVQADEVEACDHPEDWIRVDHGLIDGVEGQTCDKCGGYRSRKVGEEWPKWEAYGSKDFMSGSSGWSEDLALALVKEGFTLQNAIIVAASACERCMNVLAHECGLDWGYPEGSEDYNKCGTSCALCEG